MNRQHPLPGPGAVAPRRSRIGPTTGLANGLNDWLQAPGSLSRHLAATGTCFEVQLLWQGLAPARPHEARGLGCAPGWPCLVREVLLRVDGLPLVCARSLAPHRSTRGAWRALRTLGGRPLAEILFQDPGVRRSPLRVWRQRAGSADVRHMNRRLRAAGVPLDDGGACWGRYSVFHRQGAPLLVQEVFLPAMTGRARVRPGGVGARCAR